MRKIRVISMLFIFIVLLTGCGTFETDESGVLVKKDGTIIEASIESFAEDYYDEKELKEFINTTIDSFNKENSCKVKLNELEVTKDKAISYLQFENAKEYALFSGNDFFVGSVPEAIEEGYNLDGEYYSVKDNATGDAINSADIDDSYNVVISKNRLGINVKGTIYYVSNNVTIKGDGTVSPIRDDDGIVLDYYGDEYIVIFYK